MMISNPRFHKNDKNKKEQLKQGKGKKRRKNPPTHPNSTDKETEKMRHETQNNQIRRLSFVGERRREEDTRKRGLM
jgi:hypothetical protein